ncbi:MAG: 4-hydroxyphenylpyruvate dioxygenase [Alphaproteobacteria bacterium]|nr:4-hydroxyphenylpyruvate dioxygenase [Alphaproteobacteria bacterium]
MGTDGFEFVEFTAPDISVLDKLFTNMGFALIARHRSKNVLLYKQGKINFIVNGEREGFSQDFAKAHGPSCCAIAFRVRDAGRALQRALSLGAKQVSNRIGPMELNIPVIEGIGGSHIYLIDQLFYEKWSIYDIDFVPVSNNAPIEPEGLGLTYIDHLTHNVYQGRMDVWADFYERIFNFREIRYFDIEGKLTGLKSRALTSPCGKIRIPINESADDKSQIAEYLDIYKGEGIQHIALGTDDIYRTVELMNQKGVKFLAPPPVTYYEMVPNRLPNHNENIERLQKNSILIDGSSTGGLLLQIFTETVIGPIFFEVIQRKGDEGFGEGNFRALFESIEQDQLRRGVLKEE